MSSFERRRLAFTAFILFHASELALRILPFKVIYRFVQNLSVSRRASGRYDATELIEAMQDTIRAIRRFDYRARPDCLPRALMVYCVLVRRGLAVDLLLGVRKKPFSAHAWVEYGGEVVSEYKPESHLYTPLTKLSAAQVA